jgi:PAS domain S-box-containing protein
MFVRHSNRWITGLAVLSTLANVLFIFVALHNPAPGHTRLLLYTSLVLLLCVVGIVFLTFRSARVFGRRVATSLKESEDRYTLLVNNLKDHAVLLLDPAGHIVTWNRGAEILFGYRAEEVLEDHISRFSQPEDRGTLNWRNTFKEPPLQSSYEEHGWRVRKDGSLFWAETVTTPLLGDKNVLLGYSQVLRDISLRKKNKDTLTASLHEKEALLKEIHHRVKNNLQMISSLLRLQSENIQDPALLSIFVESQNRVRSMAIIHECLYQSPDLARLDFSDYVNKLTDNLLRTFSVPMEKVTLRVNVDKVPLTPDIAIPCGLILTELVSNALKYAYPAGRAGTIFVTFRVLPPKGYELTVADEGVGLAHPIDFESNDSLGLRLVHLLTEQLRGQLKVESHGGTRFTITFNESPRQSQKDGGTL